MSEIKHKIELLEGYTDTKGVRHTLVEFGKRLTVKDLIALDNDPQGKNPTQYQDLVRRKMMTKFGTIKGAVPLNVLLGLNAIDREDLQSGADKFNELSCGERTSEYLENNTVKLRFGFEMEGTFYDVVQFGNLTTGRDEVEADSLNLQGVSRLCFLLGRQISKISTEDGLASIDGQIDLETFASLDAGDLNLLRMGGEFWRLSFRLKRANLQGKRNGEDSVHSNEADEHERSGDSESAD